MTEDMYHCQDYCSYFLLFILLLLHDTTSALSRSRFIAVGRQMEIELDELSDQCSGL